MNSSFSRGQCSDLATSKLVSDKAGPMFSTILAVCTVMCQVPRKDIRIYYCSRCVEIALFFLVLLKTVLDVIISVTLGYVQIMPRSLKAVC
jgi:hypothetical protein